MINESRYVKLVFHHLTEPTTDKIEGLSLDVEDIFTKKLVFYGAISEVDEFLKKNNYKYVLGSRALWEKARD